MQKAIFKSVVYFIFLLPILSMVARADDITSDSGLVASEKCKKLMSNLDDTFYEALLSERENSVNDGLEILKNAKPCEKTQEQKAQLSDLNGEASHLAYKYSKEEKFFQYSLKAYGKALDLNTPRNELVFWHLSRLMRTAGDFEHAMQYINKVLDMEPRPKDPLPYLITAFQLSVDTKKWDDAKGLIQLLSKKSPRFYQDPDVLLSAVDTLCHFNQLDDARTIISNVENHVPLKPSGKDLLNQSKKVVESCGK